MKLICPNPDCTRKDLFEVERMETNLYLVDEDGEELKLEMPIHRDPWTNVRCKFCGTEAEIIDA